jgi:hypothetical protein
MSFALPLYYVLRRDLTDEQISAVKQVLYFTPVNYAIIHDALDGLLAAEFAPEVVRVREEADVLRLAKQIGREIGAPVILFGDAELVDVVYDDGRQEPVPCKC